MSLESDRELLDAFRRGDRVALARVYRLYVDEVARALRAGVRVTVEGRSTLLREALPETDIEALVQETFARAFAESARLRYDGVRPYGAYLTTIARNLLVDRARLRDREVLGGDVGREATVEQVDATTVLEDKEVRAVIARLRAGLDEREEAVFKARYDDGLTLRDTAKALPMSLISVRRIDAALRQRLLQVLRDAGYLRNVEVGIPSTKRDRSKG